MNILSHHEPQQPDVCAGSTQMLSPGPLPSSKHSKRVCFYKSGDAQFSGHCVVINNRTFRTFDALLTALSNKVPLPFGVRTITTPKGTHTIRSLDDLQHGGSYVCSDKRKVKVLNLDEINRRHVPWNSTRPTSAGRQRRRGLIRQLLKKNEVGRMAKKAAKTLKRLVVFKNTDPGTKRIVALPKGTAPTFEALLEYLSQLMQFPVVKLYTADGRRVEDLPCLILCSGVIIAAGNEPFQLANFNPQASSSHSQPSHSVISESTVPTETQPLQISRRARSRHCSVSSERYSANRIDMSPKGIGSTQSINKQALETGETDKCGLMPGVDEKGPLIIASDDEVEKSLRVNQDGSMTVEMKVRLTIKQEETIHWSTTVSRACVNISSYKNNNNSTRASNIDGYESNDENTHSYKPIELTKAGKNHSACATSEAKPCFRRLPTPGPRRVRRIETSVAKIKSQSQTEVRDTSVGTYSHLEKTAEGELSEGYSVVSHSSSSSTRPVPKPRRKHLGVSKHNKTQSSLSGISEDLQLNNKKGKEFLETLMHIHPLQDTEENYLAKPQADDDRFKIMSKEHKKPNATEASSGYGRSSNNELLSLVSGSEPSRTKNTSTVYENAAWYEFSDNRLKISTEDAAENKGILNKYKIAHKSKRSNKQTADKKQKGCVLNVLKQKISRSPVKGNASHANMLMDTCQNVNFSRNVMVKPHAEDKIVVISSSHSAPSEILSKQKCVNGGVTNAHKEYTDLSESVSMQVRHSSSCNVHEYVEKWLENNHPASAPSMDELNLPESRARFQIQSDFSYSSAMRSDKDRKPVSQLVQIKSEGQSVETQKLERFCKSLPSVRMHTDELETCTRQNTSLEDLVLNSPDAGSETSPNAPLNPRSGMKQDLPKICSPTKCIRMASSHSCQSSLTLMRKSSSLPDLSSHLASVFGFSSKTLLSFLIMMNLRDGYTMSANEDSGNANSPCSNPETLQVMKSIPNLVSMKDEEEIKASLASLDRSMSAQLKKNWKDFQETYGTKENHSLTPSHPEKKFVLEVNSEKGDQEKGHTFSLNGLKEELNLCEDSHKQISSHVGGDSVKFVKANPMMGCSDYEKQIISVALEDDDAITEDNLGEFLEEKQRYFEPSASDDITNETHAELAELSNDSEEIQSTSNKIALPGQKLAIDESDRGGNVPFEDITNQKRLVVHVTEIVDDDDDDDDDEAIQERHLNKELSEAYSCEDKHEMMDNVQTVEKKYTKDKLSLGDVVYVPDYFPTDRENRVEWEKSVGCIQAESELFIPTLETKPDVIDDTRSEWGQNRFEGCDVKLHKENDDCKTISPFEKLDMTSVDAEAKTKEGHCPNDDAIETEKKNASNKPARTEAYSFSRDEGDPYSNNDNGPKDNDIEETISSSSVCETPAAKPHHYSLTHHKDEHSDYYKSASGTWQESKTENKFQKSVSKRQAHNTKENHKNEDYDSDPNSPLHRHREREYFDQSETSNSLEENETHEADSNAVDTDKGLDILSHHGYLDDPSIADFQMRKSCERVEKHKAQTQDSAGIEKADRDHTCHCVHPPMLPQQLLDFVNLALMSSALIFTYDSNGFLRLEPDRHKRTEMPLSKHNATECLPSPNTSDLSDYRPDTSDSAGDQSLVSTDLFTESGEDEAGRTFIYQGNMKQCFSRNVNILDNNLKKPHPGVEQIASPVYCSSSGSIGNTTPAQGLVFQTKPDFGEGILIDKGRWLLKENHLIRKSPPVPIGMYDNGDTTSVDTGHTSDDASCIPNGTRRSQLAVISSSELEDMTKPSTPKCTYFNMVHSSDSDPFLDNQSITSNKVRGFTRKSKEVSPLGQTARTCGKKNGSLPSFSSVEFKLAAVKVHPEDDSASSVLEKSGRSQSLRGNISHEEEAVEGLSRRCGQHCSIL